MYAYKKKCRDRAVVTFFFLGDTHCDSQETSISDTQECHASGGGGGLGNWGDTSLCGGHAVLLVRGAAGGANSRWMTVQERQSWIVDVIRLYTCVIRCMTVLL